MGIQSFIENLDGEENKKKFIFDIKLLSSFIVKQTKHEKF